MKKKLSMALLQLTILPIGTPTATIGDYILTIHKRLSDMGATFALNDMGTLIEGKASKLLKILTSQMKFLLKRER